MNKIVAEYEIVDHGVENSQYFQGCGVSFTEFTDVGTGIGNDYAEAFDDALEMLAQNDWETDTIKPGKGSRRKVPSNSEDSYYYVSVRVREKEEEATEPEEGDYVTEDHLHWHEYGTGKLLLTTEENEDHCKAIKAHMKKEGFFPNVWFLSDHGNFHRISL